MPSITLRHIARLKATNGINVTISRGVQTCELVAVPARSTARLIGQDGSFSIVEVADWLIIRSEWTLTAPAEPIEGDQIQVEESTRYLVSHPDINTPLFTNFNQLDRPALAWRVHSMPM